MNASIAQRVIESLRKGIPPDGYITHFTVGREAEIKKLTSRLSDGKSGALLLKANYGSGKTHLLKFIREKALSEGYAVSTVTLDAKSAIRFNRMDQILGAVLRGLEIPEYPNVKGIRAFFDLVCQKIEACKAGGESEDYWLELTNTWRWSFSEVLESPGLYLALRAWATGDEDAQNLVEDWLFQTWSYNSQRKRLFGGLIGNLRSFFRDPRPEWQFYSDGVFRFDTQGYSQSWDTLKDIQSLSKAAGLKGLIILFDEFEDILNNINNIAWQQAAFWNLFQFYGGRKFPGMTYFAVTPEFVHKCKKLLQDKGQYDYDYSQFEVIPTFQMTPLTAKDLEVLALKILETHAVAFNWKPGTVMDFFELKSIVEKAASIQVEDRARHTIREVVKSLDRLLEDAE